MSKHRADTGDGREDGRVSLHPLEFEEALEALLATPKESDEDEEGDDDGDA